MMVEDACRIILGRSSADEIIADMGLHWAIVAAMAAAVEGDDPDAIEAIRNCHTSAETSAKTD